MFTKSKMLFSPVRAAGRDSAGPQAGQEQKSSRHTKGQCSSWKAGQLSYDFALRKCHLTSSRSTCQIIMSGSSVSAVALWIYHSTFRAAAFHLPHTSITRMRLFQWASQPMR